MATVSMSWIQDLNKAQHDNLVKELVSLDTRNVVNRVATEADIKTETDVYIWKIQQGVERIVGQLEQALKKKRYDFMGQNLCLFGGNSRFDGGGSFYCDTKIGLPDEMDFVYEWDISVLGSIFIEEDEPGALGIYIGEDQERLNVLEPKEWFKETISDVLDEIVLPGGWTHGGFNEPTNSGLRVNGKVAFMMQLVFDDGARGPLELTIDLVLLVKVVKDVIVTDPNCEGVTYPALWTILHDMGFDDKVWLMPVADVWYPVSTMAQKSFLTQLPASHPLKKSIRTFKILTKMAPIQPCADDLMEHVVPDDNTAHEDAMSSIKQLQTLPPQEKLAKIEDIKKYLMTCNLSDMQQNDSRGRPEDRWATYGECVPNPTYLTSYMIQSLALLFSVLDIQAEGDLETWTDDKIPEVLVNIIELVQRDINVDQVGAQLSKKVFSSYPKRTMAEALAAEETVEPDWLWPAGTCVGPDMVSAELELKVGERKVPILDTVLVSMNKLIKETAASAHLDELMRMLRKMADDKSDRPLYSFQKGVEDIQEMDCYLEGGKGKMRKLHAVHVVHDKLHVHIEDV